MNIHPVATCKATQQSLEEKWPPHQKKRMTIPNGKKYIFVDKTLCERFLPHVHKLLNSHNIPRYVLAVEYIKLREPFHDLDRDIENGMNF